MSEPSFPPWPQFAEDEVAAVARVLRSGRVNYWTGEECAALEAEFAAWAGVEHAVSVANGTVALELCLQALGIGPGDDVIVPARSFFASASCVAAVGARPVFADVSRSSGNLTLATIEAVLSPQTRAVIVVHLAGWPADMDPIMDWASRHDVVVIEDCAQAHGACYKGRSVGCLGHVAAWSFCQDKIISTGGEGGMVTTSDPSIWSRVWSAKDHGKSWSAMFEAVHPPGFRWVHNGFGGNARMTEMQAAIGRIQLGKLPQWHAARATNSEMIRRALAPLAKDGLVILPFDSGNPGEVQKDSEHGWYRYLFQVELQALQPGWTRQRIADAISAAGYPAFVGPCPEIYLERAFDETGWRPERRMPSAQALGEASIAMLVHPTIPPELASRAGEAAAAIIREATRGQA